MRVGSGKIVQDLADIRLDAEAALADRGGTRCTAKIDAGVERIRVHLRVVPERVLDDDGRIESDAELQIEDGILLVRGEERFVARLRRMPALVLDEAPVSADADHHRTAIVRTDRHEFFRHDHLELAR